MTESMVLERAHSLILEKATAKAQEDIRGQAASAVLGWIDDGDATFDAFDSYALDLADIDVDSEDEPTDEQNDAYNTALAIMADAAVSFGADESNVAAMINDEDDDAASDVMDQLSEIDPDEEDELITAFSFGDSSDSLMMEAVKRVVRAGKVKLIKKRPRPRRLNAAQKASLRKARKKANTASAKIARRKSMKIRKKRIPTKRT